MTMRKLARVWVRLRRRVALVGLPLACATLALAPGLRPAEAASPPGAYTGEAAQLTTTSATLNGSVSPGNQSTSYYFQYGTTTSYEAQTPVSPAGGGSQSIHVSAPVSGLSVYTTYHYRLAAVNPAGTRFGLDRTFTTKKIPLTVLAVASPSRDPFGSPIVVSGMLSGTESAHHTVVLQANPFPYLGGFKAIGNPELTEASGAFSFPTVSIMQNTQLRVSTVDTPPTYSRVMVERVAVRVTLHLRPTDRHGFARLYGTVTPAEFGALVYFQLLRPGRGPTAVGSTVITAGMRTVSRFSHVVHIRRAGLYRAVVIVASGAQVSNHSRAILIG
jgi:hypothetical protein